MRIPSDGGPFAGHRNETSLLFYGEQLTSQSGDLFFTDQRTSSLYTIPIGFLVHESSYHTGMMVAVFLTDNLSKHTSTLQESATKRKKKIGCRLIMFSGGQAFQRTRRGCTCKIREGA